MSYHTHVDFQFSDEPPIDSVLDRARIYLEARGIYAVDDLLEDLRAGFEEGNGLFNKFMSHDFEGLMEHVSAGFPGITFYVRGMGEEYGDVWLRQFADGKTTARTGPFEDDE
ncbi:MAG TPA: hypothetical protein VGR35_10905 [Tepidisphaeraceae bacterium]|nr:hypothetical protein [Tepidisphaeraceae bacterium]